MDHPRAGLLLRSAGIAAMTVAALGAALVGPTATADPPVTDSCQLRLAGDRTWQGSGCDAPATEAPRESALQ
ncbi:hypothetical protein [Nocardioides hwasunensis]|uniref:Uncharacterized protein n=1 Tax=Nocardioides hwasunensis TaxID=397258 RepID=A0ABR8MJ81_9ACTN|nr:hypothetical protein [Nocardioides hwasunensis]MBD3915126.1 hypothetical protein [Nocardioides hwasunensis]